MSPHLRHASQASSAVVFSVALAIWVPLAALAAVLLWADRRGEIDEAQMRGAATTALLQAHTATTFHAVDNVLAEVTALLERQARPLHDESLRLDLRKRIAPMPYVRALFVIGPDGRILHDTDYPTTPQVSLADRPYFQQYLVPDAVPVAISSPMLSRSGLGWFVAMTRGIGDAGEFRGVAAAAIQLAYFSDLYKTIGLGEGSEILLFHRDGRLIAQHPGDAGKIGESYAAYPLFVEHLRASPTGAYLARPGTLPYLRVVNYAALPDLPLVVVQTQKMEAALGRWKTRAWVTGGAMLLLLATFLYLAGHYLRLARQRQAQLSRNIQGEKMEALGQLTGGVAHDFGNLLGIVATNLHLIRRLGGGSGQLLTALERADRAVHQGSVLTRQLMTLSRKRELQLAPVELTESIASMMPLLEHAAGPECKIVLEASALPCPCLLDPVEFEVALINLVVNARHAVGRAGRITITTRMGMDRELGLAKSLRRHRYACVSVTDNGRGMSEEVRRRAVEPFFSTKGTEGTGFGLAQVSAMMHQLGGDLALESEVGVGTTVHLCFPEVRNPQAGIKEGEQ